MFNLHCPDGPPELRENYRFARKTPERIAERLAADVVTACEKWGEIHGND